MIIPQDFRTIAMCFLPDSRAGLLCGLLPTLRLTGGHRG
jgi:hypothetical protein